MCARMAAKRKAGASKVTAARAKVSKRAKRPAAVKARPKPAARRKAVSRARAKPKSAMFQKVAFTMFSVSDPTRARTFYEGVLGLERGLASPDGVWTEYDLPGGGCLALFCHPDPKAARAPGGASIAFEVADLDALNERLAAEGVVYQGDVVHGPNCRMSNILDSEGNSIILHELNRAK
jgi:catechol 2,3-dioxygenase-like lactoylglutathione lyase family enzyme